MKCDGTRAETRFRLSAKRTSPFKSAGASVQSATGRQGVFISGSNDGYTMFRGSVKSIGYPLHSPGPVLHRVPSHFNWTLSYMISSLRGDLRLFMLRNIYFTKFKSLIRYGIILWGG